MLKYETAVGRTFAVAHEEDQGGWEVYLSAREGEADALCLSAEGHDEILSPAARDALIGVLAHHRDTGRLPGAMPEVPAGWVYCAAIEGEESEACRWNLPHSPYSAVVYFPDVDDPIFHAIVDFQPPPGCALVSWQTVQVSADSLFTCIAAVYAQVREWAAWRMPAAPEMPDV